ncbi:Kinesin-like protein [Spironucleus salmonicida]|uniref:Kinesin-like protein n=1 Tax=Spironucleus salmonicida TaxID=348837 RepID=V6LES0_9EUKA|nr:Kinesin-like protein [Spironucleus salmonicida]|eukprot:EST43025.1 Kinesin-14 [Spironucleus salmonicida]
MEKFTTPTAKRINQALSEDRPSPVVMKNQPILTKDKLAVQSKFRKANQLLGKPTQGSLDTNLIAQLLDKQSNNDLQMNKTLMALSEQVSSLSKDREALLDMIKELKQQKPSTVIDTDARIKIQQQETEFHLLANQLNQARSDITEKDVIITQLTTQLQATSSTYTENQTSYAQLQSNFDDLKHRFDALNQLNNLSQAEINNYNAEKAQIEAKMAAILAENRELSYHIQDLKGKIRVAVRVRPVAKSEKIRTNFPDFATFKKNMQIFSQGNKSVDGKDNNKFVNYYFDRVFNQKEEQYDVFSEYQPLVQQVFSGHKILFIAYGQSGSGKTHTMFGNEGEQAGLMPRSINYLFEQLGVSMLKGVQITVSFYEIYNDKVFDLLGSDLKSSQIENQPKECKVQTIKDQVSIIGLSEIEIKESSELLDLVQVTMSKRRTSSTILNDVSSRSHAIFTVHVAQIINEKPVKGSLTLVDLAGSEQVQNTNLDAQRKQESIFINMSLSSLSNVFVALSSKSPHINFRDSKLTTVLQEYFQGDSKAVMIVCLNEESDCYNESMNTLKFAQRIKGVSIKK